MKKTTLLVLSLGFALAWGCTGRSLPGSTHEAAFDLVSRLTKEDKEALLQGEFWTAFSESLGPRIRNRYRLWESDSELVRSSASPESASFAILREAQRILTARGNPLENWMFSASDWPESCEEAVSDLLGYMSEEKKDLLRQTREDRLFELNHSLGAFVRDRYGLSRGNWELHLDCLEGVERGADEASHVILKRGRERLLLEK